MNIEDLKQFCCRDESRQRMCQPWSVGEHTIATDGHILIKIPRLAEVPENPNAVKIENNQISKSLSMEPAEWVKIPAVEYEEKPCPACNGEKIMAICPECDGEGYVLLVTRFSIYDEETCKTCEGKGQISADRFNVLKKQHKLNHEIIEESCDACYGTGFLSTLDGVMVNGVKIGVRFAHLIGKLPNAEIGTFGKYDPVRFRFDGGEGLVMPMLQEGE